MLGSDPRENVSTAVDDFRRARGKVTMARLMARLRGKSDDLLPYEEVRKQLRAVELSRQDLREIPIDSIVGSVGRYSDFTRGFLPTRGSDADRWARVKVATSSSTGLPPVEVFQVGDTYFVKDGHHRISVARQSGAKHIEAYVTPVRTRVPLDPSVQPKDLCVKSEQAEFLEQTHFDELFPQEKLTVSEPGGFTNLLEHVVAHRYFLGVEQQREVAMEEAVRSWYHNVYLPIVEPIRQMGLLRDFPGRTEADLHLWILAYRADLREELGWDVQPADVARDLTYRFSPRMKKYVNRIRTRLYDRIMPDPLESGPPPGAWRTSHIHDEQHGSLIRDVLVPLRGDPHSWDAWDQAVKIAHLEGSHILGLHVQEPRQRWGMTSTPEIEEQLNMRSADTGVRATFLSTSGAIPRKICDYAHWVDLVVLSLSYAPPGQSLSRLGHGFRTIVRRCPQPLLVVPGSAVEMESALVAFDGSPKAMEALYISAYIAQHWKLPLFVLSSREKRSAQEDMISRARAYLESHGVQAVYIQRSGDPAEEILDFIEREGVTLTLMGGYGHNPVREVMLGSSVDRVLQESRVPTLICR
jgi:nucleotide-binding universal stress UspA family protein